MLGGSVIIETVFSVPGIGKLASDAIFGRDYAVVPVSYTHLDVYKRQVRW